MRRLIRVSKNRPGSHLPAAGWMNLQIRARSQPSVCNHFVDDLSARRSTGGSSRSLQSQPPLPSCLPLHTFCILQKGCISGCDQTVTRARAMEPRVGPRRQRCGAQARCSRPFDYADRRLVLEQDLPHVSHARAPPPPRHRSQAQCRSRSTARLSRSARSPTGRRSTDLSRP
jgi:hypothetical protein